MNGFFEKTLGRWVSSRILIVGLLLLAWGLRICCLKSAPPGWRDDELINMYSLSGEVLEGHYPLYFTGASGHEPLYHYLHAVMLALFGFNTLGGVWLSAAFGTLSVALIYVLARRLYGPVSAALCTLLVASSFWSLMYSRIALRHVSLLSFALAFIYWYWRWSDAWWVESELDGPRWTRSRVILLGVVLGLSLYTYAIARMLVFLPLLLLLYLFVFHRRRFADHWRATCTVLLVAALVAAPLLIAILGGMTDEAAQGIGAEGRLFELAEPIRHLLDGDVLPMLKGLASTLGMFTSTGDAEWLYNIPGRPVLGWVAGLLLWIGVVRCVAGWREPGRFVLLAWFALGLLPGFVIVPAASLGHTILAQPVAYILMVDALIWICGTILARLSNLNNSSVHLITRTAVYLAAAAIVLTSVGRDIRDYFVVWPQEGMVQLLYRADYRELAAYLNENTQVNDVAVSSALLGPWDRLAVETDVERDDLSTRFFNPDRALIWLAGQQETMVLLTLWPDPDPPVLGLLDEYGTGETALSDRVSVVSLRQLAGINDVTAEPIARYANGLALVDFSLLDTEGEADGESLAFICTWIVERELDLPPIPVVANPPPPGVYSGPRLAVFTHLLDGEGELTGGDDGLWVDPVTLQPGDYFAQVHQIEWLENAAKGGWTLEIGLYDPMTGERWMVVDGNGLPLGDSIVVIEGSD